MLPRLDRLSLQCAPCKIPVSRPKTRDQYKRLRFEPPNGRTPEEEEGKNINICSICNVHLERPPQNDATLPGALEQVYSSVYHRWCLAKWVWDHNTDPNTNQIISPNEIAAMLLFRPRPPPPVPPPPPAPQFVVEDAVPVPTPPSNSIMAPDGSGSVQVYAGNPENTRLLEIRYPDGTVEYYTGSRGQERKITSISPSGYRSSFAGDPGQESLVIIRYPESHVEYYRGDPGEERMYSMTLVGGQVQHYDGIRGQERLVQVHFRDGSHGFYEGAPGEEHLVRVIRRNGESVYYAGPQGQEQPVGTRSWNSGA